MHQKCPFASSLKPTPNIPELGIVPHVVIWSWEHEDDLTFIDPKQAGVAYFAGTIVLGRDNATMLKRKNPIHLNEQTVCFPSFRIENAHSDEIISDLAFSQAISIIKDHIKEKHAGVIQIDFDATQQDKKPYLKFLQELRKALPEDTAISITALASWCLYDKWLQQSPVDETVAMMFSLGRGKGESFAALKRVPLDSGAPCAQSLGISVNEPDTNVRLSQYQCFSRANRIYIFSSLGWSKRRYENIMAALARQ